MFEMFCEFFVFDVEVSAERIGNGIGFSREPLRVEACVIFQHEVGDLAGNFGTRLEIAFVHVRFLDLRFM